MTREEAINVVRSIYQTDAEREALAILVPELREREDERIRKKLYKTVLGTPDDSEWFQNISKNAILTYLEKQKEQLSIEWKPQPESLEALMYAIEGNWDAISPTSYLSRRLEDLYEGLVNTFNVDESLLTELPKVASRADTAEGIEELRKLKHKIEASMEQKSAKWSEEDERKLQRCIEIVESWEGDYDIAYTPYSNFLKSLRPSWKPSEHQMSMLLAVINDPNNAGSESCHISLKSLYNDLKKL